MYLRVWSLMPGATSQQAQIKTVADFYSLYLHRSPYTPSYRLSYYLLLYANTRPNHTQWSPKTFNPFCHCCPLSATLGPQLYDDPGYKSRKLYSAAQAKPHSFIFQLTTALNIATNMADQGYMSSGSGSGRNGEGNDRNSCALKVAL